MKILYICVNGFFLQYVLVGSFNIISLLFFLRYFVFSLFIDDSKLDKNVNNHLCISDTKSIDSDITVEIHPYEDVNSFIACLAETTDGKIWVSFQDY